jgi:thimet oligopeptidase
MEPLQLPADASGWPEFVRDRADTALARARELISTLKDGAARSSDQVLALWNACDLALGNASAVASLFAEVHPDEAVRTLAEQRQQEVTSLTTERGLDRELYEVLAALDASALDKESGRLLAHALRDFRRTGVDRDEQVRARLRELAERSTVVEQEFSRNIRDDMRSIRIAPERLTGLPPDFIERHPAGDDGLVTITTDYPDVIPFRTFAADAAARRELMVQFLNRAWPQNDALLAQLLALRAERAELLGYADWADYDAEIKMVGSGPAIGEFIDRITQLAAPAAHRDVAVLLARKQQDDPAATALDSSDTAYYAELVRREQFDVDAQQVRRYFDFGRVRDGLLAVTGRLFGVQYEPVDAPAWHEDVAVFDVVQGGTRIGRIYLDLHPRAGKYKHAAQFDLASGVAQAQLPEGALVCNLPRGLVEHSDVVTLFHEFGHLLHHVLAGAQRYARFSGVATEWDFVEAPSQMLEEWAWDATVLRTFAVDADGEPIPEQLVARMRAAKDFGKGYLARIQMFYAALAYRLHVQRPDDITALVRELQGSYDVFAYIEGTHFHASFGHLDGYTSGYYTYMWSLVIAKDLFSAFDADDLFDEQIAARYRERVLARGGAADAAELVADFLGRPYSFEAFGRWLEAAPRAVGRVMAGRGLRRMRG